MNSKRRLSVTSSAHKLKLDSVNKIIKFDKNKHKKETINKQISRVALAELIKNTPTRQNHQPPDFKTFLSHEENVRVFKEFLQTQYCQENLDFYLACEKYRNLDSNGVGKELVKFIATQIYNDHLSEKARQPVNVNNACVQIIKDNLKDPKPDLLCYAQAEIFELMRTDCYPRFCKTWQLDRDFAQKILFQTPQIKSNQSACAASFVSEQGTNASHVLMSTSTTTTSSTVPSRRSSIRLQARSGNDSRSSGSTSECPPECPYFRVGRLPCQGHKRAPLIKQSRSQGRKPPDMNPLDRVDLKGIHRPPTVCMLENGLPPPLLSSPPPPLPPKPENIDLNQIGNKKYCPYVGRVFNV